MIHREGHSVVDLVALIAKLKDTTSPDRSLDAQLYVLSGERPAKLKDLGYEITLWAEGENIFWKGGTVTQGPACVNGEYPRYTASLDAAMTLVPEHEKYCPLHIIFSVSESGKRWVCSLDNWWWGKLSSGFAPTAAIALCTVALMARRLQEWWQDWANPKQDRSDPEGGIPGRQL